MNITSWAIGMIEGDGSLAITYKMASRNGLRYYYYHPYLIVQLRADDSKVISKLEETIGVKGYSDIRPRQNRPNYHSNPTICSSWSSKKALMAIIHLIDRHPFIGKKAKEYPLWREAVKLYCYSKSCDERNRRIMELRQEIRTLRQWRGF